jgi:tetraacyldisaccharide 4'-kinase
LVGRDRVAAAQALLAAHPEVDLLLSDDGLQHHRLHRDLQILVFDGRGAGNGMTLPAGPLRQPLPREMPPRTWVLYNALATSTPLPGALARRELAGAVPLDAWWKGEPPSTQVLDSLAQRSRIEPLLAAAGLAEPERFFRMLESRGLHIRRCPLLDHASLNTCPWPAETTDVLVTEKDAVKLPAQARPWGQARVWVVALDFSIPSSWVDELDDALRALPCLRPSSPVPPSP